MVVGTFSKDSRFEMFSSTLCAAIALLVSAAPTFAQFPEEPVGRKVLESRFGDGVTITYKEVRSHWEVALIPYRLI